MHASSNGTSTIPPVPEAPDDLQRWGERFGVADLLDQPVTQALHSLSHSFRYQLSRLAEAPSLRAALTADPAEHPLQDAYLGDALSDLLGELRDFLRRKATSRAQALSAEAARLAEWQAARRRLSKRLPEPASALVEGLFLLRQRLRETLPATDDGHTANLSVETRLSPLGLSVSGITGRFPDWAQWRVSFDLSAGPAHPKPTCLWEPGAWSGGGDAPCEHQLLALDALLEHLLNPRGARQLGPEWWAELRRPSWERFLSSTAAAEPEPEAPLSAAPQARLVSFRLKTDGEMRLEVWEHKPLKSGGWSRGTAISVDKALNRPNWHVGPVEARALDLLAGAQAATSPSARHRLLLRALDALVGHAQLYVEGGGRPLLPLRLERGSIELRVERDDRGRYIPRPLVADSPALAQAALRALGAGRSWTVLLEQAPGAPAVRGLLVEADPASAKLLQAIEAHHPEVPAKAAPELLARLAPLEARLPLHLPPELEGKFVRPDPRPILRLRLEEPGEVAQSGGALELEVVLRPLAGGPPVLPGEGPGELAGFEEGRRLRVRRDLPAEARAAEALLASLPLPRVVAPSSWQRRIDALDDALDLVAYLQARPTEGKGALRVEWLQPPPRLTRQAKTADLKVDLADHRDWFGLGGEVEVDGERVKLALLLEAVRRQARYVQVGPHRWVALSRELRERLGGVADVVHRGRKGLEVSPLAAGALSDLLDAAGELKLCARWRSLVQRLDRARRRKHPLPRGLQAQLRPYQVEGYAWLMRLAECEMGAVLADDMGLGKTLQALAMLLARARSGPALVVAPTSVCFNWEREAARFAPELALTRYSGFGAERPLLLQDLGPGDVVVTSYGLLVEDAPLFKGIPWATLVLDEAQALKNAATQRARTVRDLKAGWAVALTGTPVENHLGELWSLFRVVAPGLLGSWEQFRERFAAPIEHDHDRSRREALGRLVRPFILRRTKAEVAPELPARTESQLSVTLSRGERRLYDDARMAALAKLSGAADAEGDRRFEVLAWLTRLRQLACHPRLYDPASKERSSKLEKLLEVVDELREEGHRALVFSQFTTHLALVREALDARQVRYLYLDGATRPKDREAAVDAFQRGEGDLFLISLKAGGTGLNLTGADYVIHLDPWWNPAVEDQATDRAHRIGQRKPVTVYRLVSQGTIEESILALHEEKRDLVAGLLEGTDRAGKLSTEQLVELIRSGVAPRDDEAPDAPAEV